MCGITGFIDYKSGSNIDVLNIMVSTLQHRGPDDRGADIYSSEYAMIGLGHTRLSIIDLSSSGHQPMNFEHLSIVLNGEIYNYMEIKKDLVKLGHKFVSGSDTEVVLHAFHEWGISCVSKFIGMFAFVIYDRSGEKFFLFRDRAGVKPLYYLWHNDLFLFGSELKAICMHPNFKKQLDYTGVGYYFKMGFIPAPFSIYQNVRKINPGYFIVFNIKSKKIRIEKYWDINNCYLSPKLRIDYWEAKEELVKILISACNYRMVADVPVGLFLSGGYDSSVVAALLQKDKTEKIKTFTIGFEEGINEALFALNTARILGTDHTEYYCTKREAQETIPLIPDFYDEPFADSSAIPTMLVSKVASKTVKVALSADGGDELFCGYDSYTELQRIFRNLDMIRPFDNVYTAELLRILLLFVPKNTLLFSKTAYLSSVIKTEKRFRASFLNDGVRSVYSNIFELALKGIEYPENLYTIDSDQFLDLLSVAQAIDYRCYMNDDILTKVDRATMSVSLEGREPLIDHRLIEFAACLPLNYLFDGNIKKKILKDIVHMYIPEHFMNRPKTGFSIPIYSWLKKDLSFLLNEYLESHKIEETGIYNLKYIQELLKRFNNNKLHDETIIWKILQFQMWYARWMDKATYNC
jgi:asparagine synthase (glutamine-hydrolysing)